MAIGRPGAIDDASACRPQRAAVASQAIEAKPAFGQIKPWRGRGGCGRDRGGPAPADPAPCSSGPTMKRGQIACDAKGQGFDARRPGCFRIGVPAWDLAFSRRHQRLSKVRVVRRVLGAGDDCRGRFEAIARQAVCGEAGNAEDATRAAGALAHDKCAGGKCWRRSGLFFASAHNQAWNSF